MTYPAASSALLRGLVSVADLHFDGSKLDQEAVIQRERLDRMVARNSEHAEMVAKLEAAYDALIGAPVNPNNQSQLTESDIPSIEELSAELDAFLRDANPE